MNKSRLIYSLGLLVILLTATLSVNHPVSAAAGDLFISEYIEGSSFNKAIEIYNGTGAAVDLGAGLYSLELYSNGAASASQTVLLSGAIADGDVFVLANGSADPAILAEADLIDNSVINFNGDDAVVLRKDGAVVDAFGQIGFDPGSEWVGGGQNDTLRRAETVCAGDTNPDDAFDSSVEWVVFAQDAFDGLGSHTANCGGGSAAAELFMSEYIEGSSFNKAIEIYNGTGAAVDLGAGLYTLELYSNGAASASQTVALSGTIADGDVFVLANGSADPAILAETDLVSSSVINFNGDDAVVLRKNGAVVDAFGQIGFDPGSEWVGGGQNDTLRRAEAVCAGDTNPDDAFDASLEWVVFAQDAFDGLGSHTANCGGVTTADPTINEFSASTTGTDVEYVEIFGSPDTDYSAYTILEIEGDSSSAMGTIDEVIAVGTTDANGFWLGDLAANSLENGTISLLLVENFTGANGDDLDSDDDGVLDVMPWDAIVDAISVNDGGTGDLTYGTPALGPDYDGISSFAPGGASRIPDGLDTDAATDWVRNDFDLAGIPGFTGSIGLGEAYNTPGAANELFVPPPLDCTTPDVTTPIYEIQGSGAFSPLDGSAVIIDGVVVGDFQPNDGDHTDLGGFFVQDPVGDGDPATSDGIFVFAPSAIDVSVGDLVRVSGTVDEFFDLTELTAVDNVLLCGTGSVAPTTITIPSDFEAVEGMLVTTAGQTLYISEFFNYDRFGEIVLTPDRQFQPTAVYAPGSPEQIALAAANAANRITLDDGRTSQNPDPAIHPNGMVFDLTNTFRGGDSLDNVVGVISYSFDLYRIQPTQGADYASLNPRTAGPDPVGGSLQVASFNVLNYFNGDGMGGGFPTSRGADNSEEFTRQRDKIIAAIVAMDADVIGLMEIENDGYDEFSAIADLVNGLNDATAPGTYAFVDPGVPIIGTDEIAVGLIYQPATVTPYGDSAILDSSVDSRFIDTLNRPALAQSFVENSSNGIFTVVVNHLKSKGSSCEDFGDPDLGDGAGNCNITRLLAAEAMVDWLATDPTGSGDSDILIIGDLNSYDKEDPIAAILAGADDTLGTSDDYTDLAFAFGGEFAYSYVFDGQLGYLDYALANSSLAGQVTGATEWHINADEPDILDYDTSFKQDAQDALYEPNAYRASDHDPVIVGLNLISDLIRNGDGCYVVALEGSPFAGLATEVLIGDAGYNGARFHAGRWGIDQGLGDAACYEIHGTNNNEILTGGLENDTFFGYDGNDFLIGLFGDDTFMGGAGSDLINGNFGLDEILDFEPGVDFCFNVEEGC